ncbi:GTP-binding protein [Halomarina litorea]|uniref:GTP-binding protein n=1 Tax=Halomarina litorea TaxID=2961595 RepID=UPI0020C4346B|nr:GTP-binding protein [Halomarina sp. BCD28]
MNDGTPVTVLSGALGAGKTTTLNYLLTNADRKLAVLVNDMGEVNVDAALIENREGGVAELSNGCICCDLRDDLEVEVSRLAREREFDHLVVESSGISEPAPVARLFTTGPASAPYDLDTLVTVVNAAEFLDTVGGDETVTTERVERRRPDRVESEGEVRPLSELLVAQVETANVLLVNKCDLVSDEELAEVEELLTSLNPGARIVRATHGEVAPPDLLDTASFDLDTVSETEAWQRAVEHADHADSDGHEGDHAGHSPQATYGIDSFVVRARRPLHPGRFADFLREFPEGVVRSKGLVWGAGREDVSLHFSQAGPSRRVAVQGRWIASLPESRQSVQRKMHPEVEWDDGWGDRRVEVVFIGKAMDEDAIRETMDECLLTEAEFEGEWDEFENPFPDENGDPFVA